MSVRTSPGKVQKVGCSGAVFLERTMFVMYADYLKTEQWRTVSRERREQDGYKCVCCGSEGNLEVHHVRYPRNWFDTTTDDLRTLCKECHVMVHRLRERFDVHKKFLTFTKNGFIDLSNPVSHAMCCEQERIIALECWKRNLFASKDNIQFINAVRDVTNYDKKIICVDIQHIWELLAFAKDCYISNSEPEMNTQKRKAKAATKTRFK